jgi:hypothetical protein
VVVGLESVVSKLFCETGEMDSVKMGGLRFIGTGGGKDDLRTGVSAISGMEATCDIYESVLVNR